MAESILDGKKILAVDDEPDVLTLLQEEISEKCPNCTTDKATNYQEAAKLLKSMDYDVVILDIMGVRGFDLLEIAVSHNLKVAMLTAHALSPEDLKKSHDMGARAYLPKDKLGDIVPFLEVVLRFDFIPGWRHLMDRLEDHFNKQFGPDWKVKSGFVSW
jgi:DNA-binding response OmpR family regulator